jgi:hypothetical protein
MTPIARRRTIAAVLVLALSLGAWYFAQPRVPEGQSPLVTLDAASLSTLRDAFNRDADHVRIVILQSPT